MLAVLTLALVAFAAILVAVSVNINDTADMSERRKYGASNFFLSPLLVMLAIAAVCLALGPGPPASKAGFSGVSQANDSADNGASFHVPFNH